MIKLDRRSSLHLITDISSLRHSSVSFLSQCYRVNETHYFPPLALGLEGLNIFLYSQPKEHINRNLISQCGSSTEDNRSASLPLSLFPRRRCSFSVCNQDVKVSLYSRHFWPDVGGRKLPIRELYFPLWGELVGDRMVIILSSLEGDVRQTSELSSQWK